MATLTNTKIKDTYKSLLKVSDNGNLEASLQEITDGEGNASGVQLNTGGDLTASGTVAFGSLKDSGENITITKFVDEADGIGSNDNDTSIPTSAAVKNYVDTNVTAQDLDFAGDSGTGAVDLDSQTFTIAGTANEIETSASGQTITVGLPDNVNIAGNLAVDTNTLYVDAANNRVGVGTSSPERVLTVNSAGTQIGSLFESTNAISTQINIKNANSTNGGFIKTTGDNIILTANNTGAEHLVVADGGNLGIGTSSPETEIHLENNNPKFTITNTNTTASGYHGIVFESLDPAGFATQSLGQIDFVTSAGATGLSARIKAQMTNSSGAGAIAFSAGAAGSASEVARITANGLTFNGDTAAANALDDYEEGTFTPVVADAETGGNTSVGGSNNGAYTKIGNQVTVVIQNSNINTTGMTSGNDLWIRNLPFTSGNFTGNPLWIGATRVNSITASANSLGFQTQMAESSSAIKIMEMIDSANSQAILVSSINSGASDIWITLTYFV